MQLTVRQLCRILESVLHVQFSLTLTGTPSTFHFLEFISMCGTLYRMMCVLFPFSLFCFDWLVSRRYWGKSDFGSSNPFSSRRLAVYQSIAGPRTAYLQREDQLILFLVFERSSFPRPSFNRIGSREAICMTSPF